MTIENQRLISGLLNELLAEEETLGDADSQLKEARARFEVASRKYAAVRDMVTAYLGHSPYDETYRKKFLSVRNFPPQLLGRYRFVHMRTGAAIVAALKEVQEPVTLEDIVERLRSGGMRLVLPRMINAALMRTSGVEKTKDGKYRYRAEEPPSKQAEGVVLP